MKMTDELMKVIKNNLLDSVFQPIISLVDGEVIGYEALTRTTENSIYSNPEVLFEEAKRQDLLWDLEILCRANAIKKFSTFNVDRLLFLNVDPYVMKDEHFMKGFTKELLTEYHLNPTSLIFEITEKSSIENYRNFKAIIDYYKEQGYKIALDDVGKGYSGLTTMAETRPMYIKIDRDLIDGIHLDNFKRAIVKSLVEFSNATNTKIIGEGIEDINDLFTLIDLGVHYGQGYLFQRPSNVCMDIDQSMVQIILEKNDSKKRHRFSPAANVVIGEIARLAEPVYPGVPCSEIDRRFKLKGNLRGIPVVNRDQTVVGIIMHSNFLSKVGTQYGWSLYMKRPIHLIMDVSPLVIDYDTSLDVVSKIVVSREEDKLYDYIIVVKNGQYYGVVPIISLLEKSMELELNIAKYANPLTGLPGNVVIEDSISKILEEQQSFTLLYFDLNDFKAYNDTYGFEKGDKIISYTAGIIQKYVSCCKEGFVGHIGGDDFVAILRNHDYKELCEGITFEFDNNIPHFYSEDDRRKGYISSTNRNNSEENFPIMSLSIAVVNISCSNHSNIFEITEIAARTKKKCKQESKHQMKSCYMIHSNAV